MSTNTNNKLDVLNVYGLAACAALHGELFVSLLVHSDCQLHPVHTDASIVLRIAPTMHPHFIAITDWSVLSETTKHLVVF